MKIAVCAKAIPEMERKARLDPETRRLDRSGDATLNGYDTYAVEEALRLKEAAGDGEIVVVSLGPAAALDALDSPLAMGADRAVLISDARAAGSDLVATAHLLATALEHEKPDLILFGQQSSDGDGSVLWATVADELRLPVISQAADVAVDGDLLTASRQTEFGVERMSAQLPAVVAVSDAINEPRYPSLKGIIAAKGKRRDVLTLADLGVDVADAGEPGSGTEVLSIAPPPSRGESRTIEDDGTAAQQILDFLVERELV